MIETQIAMRIHMFPIVSKMKI